MRRLRVLCYHDAYHDYVGALANGLSDHADVWLVHPADAAEYMQPMLRSSVRTIGLTVPRRRDPRRASSLPNLDTLARELSADVVHVQQSEDVWFNLRQARRGTTVRVDTVHDVTPHPGDGTHRAVGAWSYRRTARRATRFITHAPVLRDELARRWHVPSDRIEVLPIGELGSLYGGPLPNGSEADPLQVLFFGRIWPYKGLDRLILAMNALAADRPGLTLVVAGEGEPIERYLALASPKLRLDVRNRRVDVEESRQLFSQAAVACLPYFEASQSAALMSAYGFGVPAVVSDVGGLGAAVRHGHDGLLVPPGDVPALTAALARVLDDHELRQELRRGVAQRVATDLDWSKIGEQTVAVYERARSDARESSRDA